MTAILLCVIATLVWLAKEAAAPLIRRQITGSIPVYTDRKVGEAICLLPAGLDVRYRPCWEAKLRKLEDRPISAIRFAQGLRPVAHRIAYEANGVRPGRFLGAFPALDSLLTDWVAPGSRRTFVWGVALTIATAGAAASLTGVSPTMQASAFNSVLLARLELFAFLWIPASFAIAFPLYLLLLKAFRAIRLHL